MNTHSILVMLFYSTDILLSTLLYFYSTCTTLYRVLFYFCKFKYIKYRIVLSQEQSGESGLWPERRTLTDGRKTTRKTVLCTRIFGCFALVWQWYRIVLCKSAPYP